MSTDIKPGQVWKWDPAYFVGGAHLDILSVTGNDVEWRDQRPGAPVQHDTVEWFTTRASLVSPDATPAPLDPSKVKAGDTATVRVTDYELGTYEVSGKVRGALGGNLFVGPVAVASNGTWRHGVTLVDHQPAPEPEPEWKPGTVAEGTVNGRTVRGLIGQLGIEAS